MTPRLRTIAPSNKDLENKYVPLFSKSSRSSYSLSLEITSFMIKILSIILLNAFENVKIYLYSRNLPSMKRELIHRFFTLQAFVNATNYLMFSCSLYYRTIIVRCFPGSTRSAMLEGTKAKPCEKRT